MNKGNGKDTVIGSVIFERGINVPMGYIHNIQLNKTEIAYQTLKKLIENHKINITSGDEFIEIMEALLS